MAFSSWLKQGGRPAGKECFNMVACLLLVLRGVVGPSTPWRYRCQTTLVLSNFIRSGTSLPSFLPQPSNRTTIAPKFYPRVVLFQHEPALILVFLIQNIVILAICSVTESHRTKTSIRGSEQCKVSHCGEIRLDSLIQESKLIHLERSRPTTTTRPR